MFFRQYAKKYTAFRTLECMYFCIQSVFAEIVGEGPQKEKHPFWVAFLIDKIKFV